MRRYGTITRHDPAPVAQCETLVSERQRQQRKSDLQPQHRLRNPNDDLRRRENKGILPNRVKREHHRNFRLHSRP